MCNLIIGGLFAFLSKYYSHVPVGICFLILRIMDVNKSLEVEIKIEKVGEIPLQAWLVLCGSFFNSKKKVTSALLQA